MIFNLGGAAFKPPVLNPNYPENVTVIEGRTASATFDIVIQEQGEPAEYTYQWFVNGVAVEGANGPSYTKSELTSQATYTVYCEVANEVGVVTSRIATLTVESGLPEYTFSGSHQMIDDGAGDWRINLLTTGFIKFDDFGSAVNGIEVFSVGGGGGGCNFNYSKGGGAGGGGGYTRTDSFTPVLGEPYEIVIGAGGGAPSSNDYTGADGGQTSAFGFVVNGGKGGVQYKGGDGGSGGGAGSGANGKALAGGYDGDNGVSRSTEWPGGTGQGTTTREFGETNGALYAGGGAGTDPDGKTIAAGGEGGGGDSLQAGEVNTGGGGGGGSYTTGKGGGSGIVIIRNKR